MKQPIKTSKRNFYYKNMFFFQIIRISMSKNKQSFKKTMMTEKYITLWLQFTFFPIHC